jgi:hypothetical protein
MTFTSKVSTNDAYYDIASDYTPYSIDMLSWTQTGWAPMTRPTYDMIFLTHPTVPETEKFIFTGNNYANQQFIKSFMTSFVNHSTLSAAAQDWFSPISII